MYELDPAHPLLTTPATHSITPCLHHAIGALWHSSALVRALVDDAGLCWQLDDCDLDARAAPLYNLLNRLRARWRLHRVRHPVAHHPGQGL